MSEDTQSQRGPAEAGSVEDRARGFEPSDAALRPVVIAMLSFGVLLLAGLAFPALLLRLGDHPMAPDAAMTVPPPPPRLLADPRAERLRIEARQRRALNGGPEPLDRAMQQVARQGWDEGRGGR